ncbi:uncharacterized protein LOC111105317 isoform X3 [Crassostrea virginica]
MFCLILAVGLVSCVSAASTTPPHSTHHHATHVTHHHVTHESSESEYFSFSYDPTSHYIAAKLRHGCYLYQTNAQEQTDVHTSHGLHTIETTMLNLIDSDSAKVTMSSSDLHHASTKLSHFCGSVSSHIYKLN